MARRRSRSRRERQQVAEAFLACAVLFGIGIFAYVTHSNLQAYVLPLAICVAGVACLVGILVYRRRRLLRRARTLDDLLALHPTDFERAVGELLQTWGYTQVKHTGGAGDLAADLTCRAPDGRSVVVQCKRYARHNRIRSPEVQKFIGMMVVHHRADTGIFVTTSSFSGPAWNLCKEHGIRAITGRELADALARTRKDQAEDDAR